MKLKIAIAVNLVIPVVFTLVFAAGEKITWWNVNGGGSMYSSSVNYKSCGSMTQSVAGEVVGSNYHGYTGFWTPWFKVTDVELGEEVLTPAEFCLSQNYPNPFNAHTVIEYALSEPTYVNITVYNILGQSVKVLKNELEQPGISTVIWDGRDESGSEVASGIYFYRIQAKDFIQCKMMILLK